MKKLYKRNLILHVNKFQKRILFPIVMACTIACAMTWLCLEYALANITNTGIMLYNFDVTTLQFAIPGFLIVIMLILFFVVLWTFFISNKIVGPYERIVREMDEILAGKGKGPLGIRKGDEMFEELLKRVNVFIEKTTK